MLQHQVKMNNPLSTDVYPLISAAVSMGAFFLSARFYLPKKIYSEPIVKTALSQLLALGFMSVVLTSITLGWLSHALQKDEPQSSTAEAVTLIELSKLAQKAIDENRNRLDAILGGFIFDIQNDFDFSPHTFEPQSAALEINDIAETFVTILSSNLRPLNALPEVFLQYWDKFPEELTSKHRKLLGAYREAFTEILKPMDKSMVHSTEAEVNMLRKQVLDSAIRIRASITTD